jgi:hypothetical protein
MMAMARVMRTTTMRVAAAFDDGDNDYDGESDGDNG